MENILEKLVNNSKKAIEDGIYDINESLPNSGTDLENIIVKSEHATIITEVKFSSPALGNISSRKKSTIEATRVSDWPTPTVSTITIS